MVADLGVRVVLGVEGRDLGGDRAHSFLIPFSTGGKYVLAKRGKVRAYLMAAIPGGRRVTVLSITDKSG